jgi:UDP-N-acetylglucosamine:LPS N-acetylglucosamine transferase
VARNKRILAAASGGGHWIELLRLRPAFQGYEVVYVSMFENYQSSISGSPLYIVPDASRFHLRPFLEIAWRAAKIIAKERPGAVISTGSAPMLLFILFGRLTGAKTLWIDSLAQSERLSTSGRIALKISHFTCSQWQKVAEREGALYWGCCL